MRARVLTIPWRVLLLPGLVCAIIQGCVQAHDVLEATRGPGGDATIQGDQKTEDFALLDQGLDQAPDMLAPLFPQGPSVSCGQYFTCAIRPQGGLYCWGKNTFGQLGTGDLLERPTPVEVPQDPKDPWVAVGAGRETACGLRQGGGVWCWGQNTGGQVLLGGPDAVPSPTRVPLPAKALRVTTGSLHACALLETGQIWCWGDKEEGKLGPTIEPGVGTAGPVLIEDTTGWQEVAAGSGHSCGIRQGKMWCWGRNVSAQLGTGSTEPKGTNQLQLVVGGAKAWAQVQVGQQHTCGVNDDGEMWCWGSNVARQIAFDENTDTLAVPQRLGGPWDRIALSPFHTCAVGRGGGRLVCRGRNAEGQLGLQPPPPNATNPDPRPATDLPGLWAQAAVGWFHLCGWDTTGQMSCLGRNLEGQLGGGERLYINVKPVTVVF